MRKGWTEQVPELRGELTTLREVNASDVSTLFTLFSDPAVSAFMAPPPPTLAKFAGFVAWSHQQREQGRGLCFAIVPEGMTAGVGMLQIRSMDSAPSSDAEWGFVLSAHFWSTGVFYEAANLLVEYVFTTMGVDRLEARIAQRNGRGHAAVRKLGARPESIIPGSSETGIPRDPEILWMLREDDWRNRERHPPLSPEEARQRVRQAVDAAQRELRRSEVPEGVEPYPLFLFDRRRKD